MKTKIQLINAAFSELRISGITSGPSADDIEIALEVLEDTMRQVQVTLPKLPYNFQETPTPNTESGIPAWANNAIQLKLANELGARWNKYPDQKRLAGSWSTLLAKLAPTPAYNNSTSMPLGRGNTIWDKSWDKMPGYQLENQNARSLGLDDVAYVSEDFSDYFRPGETLSTYTVTAVSAGLSVSGAASSGNTVTFNVTSNGVNGVNQEVSIDIVGTAGTERTRVLYFSVSTGLAVGQ